MNGTAGVCEAAAAASGGESMYRVTLSVGGHDCAEAQIRQVVARTRGDLRGVRHHAGHHRAQMQLQLGTRRIDDVVTALEAAGFDVAAVVVGQIARP